MKKCLKLLLIFLCNAFILQSHDENEQNRLIKLAQDYIAFVHDVGSPKPVQFDDPRIDKLFAENLTKIDNQSILFENNRQLLLPQMNGFEKDDYPELHEVSWVIDKENILIIPSVETNFVVVYFAWEHINIGKATTIAILRCNAQGQIEKIIDVWRRI